MRREQTVWYAVEEHGGTEFFDCKTRFTSSDRQWQAEDCAHDYHYEHDGWDCSWPLTFLLKDAEDGPVMGKFEVDREFAPSFSATEKN